MRIFLTDDGAVAAIIASVILTWTHPEHRAMDDGEPVAPDP